MSRHTIQLHQTSFAFALALELCWLWTGSAIGQSMREIDVLSDRPVYAALVELERREDVNITYEDPFLTFDGDLTAVSSAPRRDGKPHMLKAKHGALHISYSSELSSKPEGALQLINEVLRQASTAGYKFSARQVGPKEFHVYPALVRDATGVERKYAPLLDTQVSLPAKNRTRLEFLIEVLRQVSDLRGVDIHFWEVPRDSLRQSNINTGANVERAADLIRRVFPSDTTWSLECMPRLECFFNVIPFKTLPADVHP